MSEMEKMGMGKTRGRPRNPQDTPETVLTPRQRPVPRIELSQSDETFNLIARSLLNVSNEIPALVRDCADLKSDNAEVKTMIYQLSNNIASLQQDIAYIVSSINHLTTQPTPLTQRMQLASTGEEEMPSILRKLQDVGNGKK